MKLFVYNGEIKITGRVKESFDLGFRVWFKLGLSQKIILDLSQLLALVLAHVLQYLCGTSKQQFWGITVMAMDELKGGYSALAIFYVIDGQWVIFWKKINRLTLCL